MYDQHNLWNLIMPYLCLSHLIFKEFIVKIAYSSGLECSVYFDGYLQTVSRSLEYLEPIELTDAGVENFQFAVSTVNHENNSVNC